MNCFVCSKIIPDRDNHVTIRQYVQHVARGNRLDYHYECFIAVAGDEHRVALGYENRSLSSDAQAIIAETAAQIADRIDSSLNKKWVTQKCTNCGRFDNAYSKKYYCVGCFKYTMEEVA